MGHRGFLREGVSLFVFCRVRLIGALLALVVPVLFGAGSARAYTATSLGDFGNVTVMEVEGDYDAHLPDGTLNDDPRKTIAKEFYRTHRDDYDFLVIFTDFNFAMPEEEVLAFFTPVSNDVQGIGVKNFYNSSAYGSSGRLQGTVDMGNLANCETSPLNVDAYNNTLNTLSHEILHRWSSYVSFKDETGQISKALIGRGGAHWSYLLDSDASLEYGNDWRDNGDGTFTSVAARKYYSPLDLYLMGMIDKSQVPPLLLIDNPDIDPAKLPQIGDTISGTAHTVTIDNIIAAMGERVPSAAESKKSFTAAFIYATSPGTFLTDQLYGIENLRNGFLTRFSILTDGQGLVQVTPMQKENLPVNPGVEVPPLVPRTLPPSLEEGVAWLRNHQDETGRWLDAEPTAVRDTAEALAALGIFGADPGLDHGVEWLTSATPVSSDYLARRLEALARAGSGVDAAAAELLGRQNPDGGWGSSAAYQSNPTDTALVLRALVRAGQGALPAASRAAAYLAGYQNADGGWGGRDAFSMVQPTAHALVALHPYAAQAQVALSLERGTAFLLGKQNPDGGFGNSPSTVYDSATALLALSEIGAAATTTRRAVSYLENHQFPDGGWYDSPFQTASAIQALWRATIDPDLAVSTDDITLIPDRIKHLPTEQVVSVTVANLGRTDVPQASVALYEGAVDADHLLMEQTAAFPGLGSTTLTFPLTLDVARTYSLIAVVDPLDQVAELDEANNRSGKTLNIAETRDFAFESKGLTLSKSELMQGEGGTITARLTNAGTTAAYSVPVRFYLADVNGPLVEIARPTVDLPSGQTASVEVSWHAGVPGDNLQVVAVVDPDNQFAELDETNNQVTTPIRVIGSQLPNLSFEGEPQFSPEPALQDGTTDITVSLLNSGSVAATDVQLSYYLGSPEAGGALLGTSVVSEVKAGERISVSLPWNDIAVTGEQLIVVRADASGTIAEVDENDNQTLARLMVLSRPDLVLAPADVTVVPAAPREGEPVNVRVNIYNAGEQDATNVPVTLDIGGNVIEKVVPLVAAKSWFQFDTDLGASLSAGVQTLQIAVDPANVIRELSEENNVAEVSFGVQNADLWVSEPYISPNGDGVQDATECYYRFATAQNVSVEVRNDADKVIYHLDGSHTAAVLDGHFSWAGRDDQGEVVPDGLYQLRLVSADGSLLGSIEVTVDTNRSSLFEALGTEFTLDEVLACDLPRGAQWTWLPAEDRLLFAVTGQFISNYETGLYVKDRTTGEVSRLVPDTWVSSNSQTSYTDFKYYLSADRTRLALTFYTHDNQTLANNTELWVLDSNGNGLHKLREFRDTFAVRNVSWDPTGCLLLIETSHGIELVNTETQSVKLVDDTPGRSLWSPDGSRLLHLWGNLRIIDLLGQVREVDNDWASAYWLNSRQIVATTWYIDLENDADREQYVWLVDADGIEEPKLISDEYSHSLVLSSDGEHFAFVEGLSESGGVKKVVVVDGSGTKTVIHETPYQEIDTRYSYYDTSDGMGIISNLLWSPDGNRLAFVDRLSKPIGATAFVPELWTYEISGGEKSSTPLFGCSAFYGHSCVVKGNCWQSCFDVDPQPEMDRVRRLRYWAEDNQTLVVESDQYLYLLDLISGEKRLLPFDDPNMFLSYGSYLHEILYPGKTCDGGGSAVWRFASLQNLTADLRPVRARAAIELYGTAADLNFSDYRLEYAEDGQPDHWLPVQPPVTKPVVDSYLTPWVPPYSGSFRLRMTVEDKAGNSISSSKHINWNQFSALSDFFRSTDIFSPNGDGVLDNLELSYRVVSPIQFTAEIRNSAGEVVRHFALSYSQPGVDAIVWDGRDESGQVVPDGKYELKLLDYSFAVEVDATLPKVHLSLTPGQNEREFDKVYLNGFAGDVNLTSMWIEKRPIDSQNDWIEYPVDRCNVKSGPNVICRETTFDGMEIGEVLRFHDFRIVAKDRAGNTGIVVVPRIKPTFKIDLWGVPGKLYRYYDGIIPVLKQGDPKLHRAVGYTTFNEPWVRVVLQYWVDGQWHDADEEPQSELQQSTWLFNDPQSGSFSFNWDATPVMDKVFKIRLKAVNAAGEVRLSNEFTTVAMFGIDGDCSGYGGTVSLFENLSELHFQVVPESNLKSILRQIDPNLALEDISDFSKEKLNSIFKSVPTSSWQDYLVQQAPDEIPGNVFNNKNVPKRYDPQFFLPLPENAGEHYLLRMWGSSVSNQLYISDLIAFPAKKSCVSLRLHSLPKNSCSIDKPLGMDFYLDPVVAGGEYAFEHMAFFVKSNKEEIPIETWSPPFPMVLINIKSELKKYLGLLSVDLSQLPPGKAELIAKLAYVNLGDGLEKTEEGSLDFTIPDSSQPAPMVSLEAPLDDTSLNCRAWQEADGSWRPMSVEGNIGAALPLQDFDLCYLAPSSAGGDGLSWIRVEDTDGTKAHIDGMQSFQGHLMNLDVDQLRENGARRLRLVARDQAEQIGFDEIGFADTSDLLTQLEKSLEVFSPNGDNVKDEVTFSYHLAEDAKVSIRVSNDASVGSELLSDQLQLAGDHSFVWRGNISGIGLAADGTYQMTVSATDFCGNMSRVADSIRVDTVAPVLEFTQPLSGSNLLVGKVVEVTATTDEQPIAQFNLNADSSGSAEVEPTVIAGGSEWPARGHLGNWQTADIPGTWVLTLEAEDEAGNKGTATTQVDLVPRPILFTGMVLDPDYLSPNGDGRQDQLTVNYQLLQGSQITYEILDSVGHSVYSQVVPELSSGAQNWSWNGLNKSGATVADGAYTCRLTAAMISDPNLTQVEELSFAVDTSPPTLVIDTPAADAYLAEPSIKLSGKIDDGNFSNYLVEVDSDSGSLVSDAGSKAHPTYELPISQPLDEGAYVIHAVAEDLAGNRSELSRAFTIDRTPPQVDLQSPQNQAGVGLDAPLVAIRGSIDEAHLAGYRLQYGAGDDPQQWQVLSEQNGTAGANVSFDWPVGLANGPADGRYTLSLSAMDRAGLEGEVRRQLLIDNHPPTATIDQPAEGTLLNAPFAITGSALDGNFKQALLELAPGQCAEASLWSSLRTFGASVENGTLLDFNVLPADGDYCLRLTVTDLVGNQTVATRHFVLDTTPPAPPVLSGEVVERRDVQLSWTTAGEADLAGYRIVRGDRQLAEQTVDVTALTDADLAEGEYLYQVVAFDQAGNVSEPSNPFVAVVDRTPPLAHIAAPAAGARRGDLFDIRGSAYSESDFGEYRVSYGFSAAPTSWILLKRSTVAVSGSRLAQWDSWGLPDGLYTLRLEAKDCSGNLAEDRVQVQIDNTPPQPPVLNIPLVTQADVALSWPANPEPDIAGYLLLRNDRLVNADGVVIGSLTPYLLSGLDYADAGLVDGHYRYALIAFDQAGNQSLPSAEREIDIDTRAPKARILSPSAGSGFDEAVDIEAGADDQDIATIQVQYRPVGTVTWQNLGPMLEAAPYKTTLDPQALVLGYGELELRAVATDRGGQVDPDPAVIRVEYRDMTPPAPVQGVLATFNCRDIHLQWAANAEDDLAGYNVYRRFDNGYLVRLNASLVSGTTWNQSMAQDGDYSFVVTAVDQSGNEGEASEPAYVSLKTPLWGNTSTLTVEEQLDLSGTSSYAGSKVQLLKDGTVVTETPADPAGAFHFANTALDRGDNTFTLVVADAAGNRSCVSEPWTIKRTVLLPPPEGLQLDGVSGHDVQLSWQPVIDAEFDKYFVYRNGNRLSLPMQLIPSSQLTVSADSSYNSLRPPSLVVDGNYSSSWLSSTGMTAKWLEIDFSQPHRIQEIVLYWFGSFYGTDFEIQYWDGTDWQNLSSVQGNSSSFNSYYYESPRTTSKIRFYITGFNDTSGLTGVKEIKIYEKPVVVSPNYIDSVYQDGSYEYQVSSVNIYGMEGPLSAALPVGVGDVIPPDPPQNLQVATRPEGKALQLAWQAASADTEWFTVYRSLNSGGPYTKVGTNYRDELSLLDGNLDNRTRYFYVVTATDQYGNESAYSEEASGVPADSFAAAPTFSLPTREGSSVVVAAPSVDLSGFAEPGAQVDILRDGAQVGRVQALEASKQTSISYDNPWGYDAQLSPDRTYVAYIDDDTYYEGLVIWDRERNVSTLIVEDVSSFRWSPDGGRLVYRYYDDNNDSRIEVYDLASGSTTPVSDDSGAWVINPIWSPDGRKIVFVSDQGGDDDLWVKNLDDGSLQQLTFGRWAETPLFSPDGRYLAFLDDEVPTLIDLDSGTMTAVDVPDYSWDLAWAPGSDKLAFICSDGNWDQVFVYNLATQTLSVKTDTPLDKESVVWSPDGETLAYKDYDLDTDIGTLWIQGTGWGYPVVSSVYWLGNLQWQGDELVYDYDDDKGREETRILTPAGHFSAEGVDLTPGENPFYAVATDPSGNQSPSSGVMTVVFDTNLLTDIAVSNEDLSLFPTVPAPGEQVLANVFLHNPAKIETGAFSVDFYLWDADGNLRFLESQQVASLAAGGETVLQLAFVPTPDAGPASLLVVADPGNTLPELVESNNAASRDFRVSDAAGLELTTHLSATQLSSHQPLDIDLELLNNGAQLQAQRQVLVEDDAGHPVATLDQGGAELPYGLTRSSYAWETGVTLAGNYQVHSLVRDAQGVLLAEQIEPFEILPDRQVDLQVATDLTNYGPQQLVALSIELGNGGENSILAGLQLQTRILDPSGHEVHTGSTLIDRLYPAGSSRQAEIWNTALSPPGNYEVVVEVRSGDELLASAQTSFTINPVALLRGTLAVNPAEVVYGLGFKLPYSTENRGNQAAAGSLRLALLDPHNLTTVVTAQQDLNLAVTGKGSGAFELTSESLTLQTYRAQLYYDDGTSSQLLAEAPFRVVDGTPPQISVVAPQADQTYRLSVDLALTATDNISGVDSVTYRLDAGDWQTMPFVDLGSGRYAVVWHPRLADNGAHTVEFRAVDRAGNSRQTEPLAFDVQMDVEPPVTTLEVGTPSYTDANGKLFLSGAAQLSLSATDDMSGVAGTEYRIDGADWSPHTTPIVLNNLADGAHLLAFRSIDGFGNQETEKIQSFVIDNAPPEIVLNNLQDGGFYNAAILPVYETNDLVPVDSTMQLTMNGVPVADGQPAADEGRYQLTITATDRLGNQTSTSVGFAIDLTAPVSNLSYAGPALDTPETLFLSSATPITLTALDTGAVTSGIARMDYRFDNGNWTQGLGLLDLSALPEGIHPLAYFATDVAGNVESERQIQLTIDNTPPVTAATLDGPQSQVDGATVVSGLTQVTLAASDAFSGVAATEYRIDGGAWLPYVPFALDVDGERSIDYRSRDRLGHLESVQTLVVKVDLTPPVTTLNAGLPHLDGSGLLYVTPATVVELAASDDLAGVGQTEYRLDGGAWVPYAPFSVSAPGEHLVEFRSRDAVDNQEQFQSEQLLVDATPPQSTVTIGDPRYVSSDGHCFVNSSTTIELSATDAGSGVAGLDYRLDGGPWSSYQGGIDLAGLADGVHTLGYRASDRLGNVEPDQSKTFVVDNRPPDTTLKTDAPQSTGADGTRYVSGTTQLTLSAADELSGVAATEYRVDDGMWQTYEPFTLAGLSDGLHNIGYRSKDMLGNQEVEKIFTVIIDSLPPATTIDTGTPKLVGRDGTMYVTGVTTFTLSATDDLSGVASTEYRLDGGAWQAYAPFTLAGLADGSHSIDYRSTDALGNLETVQSLAVKVDITPPQVAIEAGEPRYLATDGILYVGPQTPITVAAEDPLSGVVSVEYRLDDGSWTDYAAFTVAAEGPHRVEARAIDRLGNQAAIQPLALVTDATPPVTHAAFGPGSFPDGERLLVTGETQLALTADDTLSGVARIDYRFDAQADWTAYQAPVSLAGLAPGEHELQVRAVDQVNNLEDTQTMAVTRMQLNFHAAQLTLPRVLIWLPPEERCDDRSHEREESSRDDDHHHAQEEDGDIADRLVSAIFAGQDAYHTVVRDEASFVRELRSGAYNVLALLDAGQPANAEVLGEIRAAVRRGTGLVAANWKQELHPLLRDVFGVVPRGKQQLDETGESAFLYPEPFGAVTAPTLVGTVQRVAVAGGQLAGMIPAPEKCEGVRSLNLHLPVALAIGDRVTVRLGRRRGHHLHLLEQESWSLSALPAGPIDLENGGADSNLIVAGLTATGVNLQLASANGSLEKDYTLELTVERPGRDYASGVVEFAADCSANPRPGIVIGPFQVTAVDLHTEKQGDDLPVVVVNRFGAGAGALLTFDPLAAGSNLGIDDQAGLLDAVLQWSVPESETARAAGVLLLDNHLDLTGMAGTLSVTESPGPGLSSPAFFGLPTAPFSLDLNLADGTEADYRYLVRLNDAVGSYSKQADLYYLTDLGPILTQSHVLTFEVAESSTTLLERAMAWVDLQLGSRSDADDEHGKQGDDRHEKIHDGDSDDAGLNGVKQGLLRIGCLPQNTRRDLEEVIRQTLILMGQLEHLANVDEAVLSDLAEYLRIAEAKWYLSAEKGKCGDNDREEGD